MTRHDNTAAPTEKDDVSTRPGPAVLLTQVASAEALAATCALNKIEIVAVPSDIGAFIVTDTDTGPGLTQILSKSVPHAQFLLLTVADDRLSATKWAGGNQGDDVPAALILDSLPSEVEGILLGATTVDELTGTVASNSLGRWKAMRTLAKAARAARTAQRRPTAEGQS